MSKQVYNAIVNVGDINKGNKGFITYHKINSLDKFKSFLNKDFPKWLFATVYDNKTKQKLYVIKP